MNKLNFINQISNNLENKNGIWFSKSESMVSFPEEGYDSCYKIEEDSFWFRHRNNCIIEVAKSILNTDDYIFDVGGGNGFVSFALEREGFKTVLVEPGRKGVINAQNRGVSNIICSTLKDANFKNNSIPVICVFDVIEHIKNDKQFMIMLKEILVENGKLLITVPAYNFLWSFEDDHADHFRRYRLKELCNRLIKLGFNIEYSTYIFSILPILIYFFRTLPNKFKKHHNINNSELQHNQRKGIISSLLDRIWEKELSLIKSKKKIPFGGSCLIVAEKR